MTTESIDDKTFRLTKATPSIWLGNGMGTARASWDLLLDGRRVAHIYHNGEWVYRLDSNPYVQHRGGQRTRDELVREVKRVIANDPVHREFWASGEFEGRTHRLETRSGPVGLITGVTYAVGDRWIATLIFGEGKERSQEFTTPAAAIEWATKKAQRWFRAGKDKARRRAERRRREAAPVLEEG